MNRLCADCARYGEDCNGMADYFSGCIYKIKGERAANVTRKFKVIPLAGDSYGHAFNVQEWNSYDGGKSFYYAGYGRFCKTAGEADDYITERMGWNQ